MYVPKHSVINRVAGTHRKMAYLAFMHNECNENKRFKFFIVSFLPRISVPSTIYMACLSRTLKINHFRRKKGKEKNDNSKENRGREKSWKCKTKK